MAKKKAPSRKRLVLKITLIGLAALFVGAIALISLVRGGVFGKLPTTEDLAALRNEEATLVLSSNGTVIGKVFAKDRTNIGYTDLPKHLVDALVATEDQRFFTHEGVDAWSYVRVFVRTIIGRDRSGGGGSTISQQIIKNLYGRERHGLLTVPVNKIKEALVAQRLEQVYSKEDVLALYFNSVPFGENMYGVESAAQRYFSERTAQLRTEEAAVLVGMLKANTAYNPRLHPHEAKGRRDQVLSLMAARGYLTDRTKDSLQALPLKIRYTGLDALDAYGYFAAKVEQEARTILKDLTKKNGHTYDIEKDGLRIQTTLDTALQQAAIRSARTQLVQMQPRLDKELKAKKTRTEWEKRMAKNASKAWKKNTKAVREVFRWDDAPADTLSYRDSLWYYHRLLNAAVLMMEPASGKVRAWVGGNDHRLLPFDQVEAHRPIASTIKPIIYSAALSKGLDPCTYLDNKFKVYDEYEGWAPDNFEHDTISGQVAMWYALMRSMNLPTIDLYFRTGVDTLKRTFRALGLPTDRVDKPALALGAADISLKEIVRAYGAFAMRGNLVTPQLIERITDAGGNMLYQAKPTRSTRALEPEIAATITTMLQRAVDNGTGASIRSRFGVHSALAGKTGTSQDYGDAWFVCYTPGLVMGTWVGARDPEVHFGSAIGTGAQLALPIIGGALVEIERAPELRKRYLLPFSWVDDYEIDLECPARRTGIEDFLRNLFNPPKEEAKMPEHARPTPVKPKKEDGLFRKLFPKKQKA